MFMSWATKSKCYLQNLDLFSGRIEDIQRNGLSTGFYYSKQTEITKFKLNFQKLRWYFKQISLKFSLLISDTFSLFGDGSGGGGG